MEGRSREGGRDVAIALFYDHCITPGSHQRVPNVLNPRCVHRMQHSPESPSGVHNRKLLPKDHCKTEARELLRACCGLDVFVSTLSKQSVTLKVYIVHLQPVLPTTDQSKSYSQPGA